MHPKSRSRRPRNFLKNPGLRAAPALLAALFSQAAWGGELLVNVFLGTRPLQGIDVELDGRPFGVTDTRGEVAGEVSAGSHRLRLEKNQAALATYEFAVGQGENAELRVAFTNFEAAPEITVDTYDPTRPDHAAATGFIQGIVTDSLDNPIADATISVAGRDEVAMTGADGAFRLELPRGTYSLSAGAEGFRGVSQGGVRVVANVGVAARFVLPESGSADAAGQPAEEVVVFGTYKPPEDAAAIEQFSFVITDAIDIDDLLRFGDSDVAAGLRRIVGVAVTGGKYANVRGLAGRYIGSTLNGALMPSTDPFRRDVQLDLFPSDILAGVEIQKSFTADLPGDTTGGVIRMTTRGIPDQDEAGLSLKVGYRDGVTRHSLLSYTGGATDWLGIDDGSRDIPGALQSILPPGGFGLRECGGPITTNCVSQAQLTAAATALPVVYEPHAETAGPELELAGKYGRRIERGSGDLGYYAALSYGQSRGSRQDALFENVQGDADGRTVWDTYNVDLNGYLVVGWEGEAGWNLTSKTMLLRDTEDRVSITAGCDCSNLEVLQVETTLEWVERQFLGQQFEGLIPLFEDHEARWRLGASRTDRESPDRRFYRYRNGAFSTTPFERSYASLAEVGLEFGADYLWPVQVTDGIHSKLRFGLLLNRRDRDSELVRLGVSFDANSGEDLTQDPEALLSAQNFQDGTFTLRTSTDETDSYEAVRDTSAVYLSADTELGDSVSVTLGARVEDYSLDLDYPFAQTVAGGLDPSEISDRSTTEVLPGLVVTYRIGESFQLRGGVSRTVSRPDITELAATVFFDAEGRQFLGCPTCEDSSIDNFDLRGEFYFNTDDSVSLALFHKTIDDPLEVTITEATNVIRTFRNADSADVSGIELDAGYGVYDGGDHALKLGGNLAWIDSEIVLDPVSARIEGNADRQLQGQSPFLANLQVAYDYHPAAAKLTLAANYFDDRIDSVTRGQTGPIVEAGRLDVNLTAEWQIAESIRFSFKIKNLLDAPIERTQRGRMRETYKTGASFSVGYSLSF